MGGCARWWSRLFINKVFQRNDIWWKMEFYNSINGRECWVKYTVIRMVWRNERDDIWL